jgi:zinc D-Ala-D-Ala dipeptidase
MGKVIEMKVGHWGRAIVALICICYLQVASPGVSAESAELVDMQAIAPQVQLDIRYATPNNFLKKAVYPVAKCLLRSPTAEKLARVQAALEAEGLGLKMFDCYRPLSVQRKMWAILPDSNYVANPKVGSRHNRGAAVDVALVDRAGNALEMPTEFDDFSDRASSDYAGVSEAANLNRGRLRSFMEREGFRQLGSEWWHFDDGDWRQYGLLDLRW